MSKADKPEPDEGLLQAYLDGAASEDEAAQAERLLARSPEARAMFERLSREQAALRALFDGEAEEMARRRPITVSTAEPSPQSRRSAAGAWAMLIAFLRRREAAIGGAALAAGLAAGMALGVLFSANAPSGREPATPGWRHSAATYHRLYTDETLAIAPTTPADVERSVRSVGAALGLDLSGLTGPEGLTLERAQLLRFNGKALAQIVFSRPDGPPIALCVLPRSAGAAAAELDFVASALLDMTAVDWSVGAYDFLVLGAADAERLTEYARRFAQRLP